MPSRSGFDEEGIEPILPSSSCFVEEVIVPVSSVIVPVSNSGGTFWQLMEACGAFTRPRTWCLYEAYHDHLLRPPAMPQPGRRRGLQTCRRKHPIQRVTFHILHVH